MTEERDPTKLADELDKQAQDMEDRVNELGSDVDNVRSDWRQKQSAGDVPGANPPDLHDDSSDSDADSESQSDPDSDSGGH